VKTTLTSEDAIKQLLVAAIEVRDTLFHPQRSVDGLMAGRLDDAIEQCQEAMHPQPADGGKAREEHER
jgi:hypothetical protein